MIPDPDHPYRVVVIQDHLNEDHVRGDPPNIPEPPPGPPGCLLRGLGVLGRAVLARHPLWLRSEKGAVSQSRSIF